MKPILLTLTGTSPLLQHNERLSDPLNEWSKKLKAVTSKRTKTDEDYEEIDRLQWFGGLYSNGKGPFMPAISLKRCLEEAAVTRRLGKQFNRAVVLQGLELLINYDGPKDPEALWPKEEFRDIRMVKVGTDRVRRCRPRFITWSVEAMLVVITDLLNMDDFTPIAHLAGQITGWGDGRNIGFGRFTVKIAEE